METRAKVRLMFILPHMLSKKPEDGKYQFWNFSNNIQGEPLKEKTFYMSNNQHQGEELGLMLNLSTWLSFRKNIKNVIK